jgi:ABC-type transporter MlaC component
MIEVKLMKALTAVGLIVLLLLRPGLAVAGAPGDQVRQSIDQLLVILKDPRLKAVGNED